MDAQRYIITGMHCAACQARVEKAVLSVDGVDTAAASLITNSLAVTGRADDAKIRDAVEKAGYGIRPAENSMEDRSRELEDLETPKLVRRLCSSIVVLIFLMYISMGHSMLGLPLPQVMDHDPTLMGLAQLILSGVILIINRQFFISGFRSLANRSPNMDSLVAIGSMASFLWSAYVLGKTVMLQTSGHMEESIANMHQLYFESAAMIVTLITVGKLLEARSKGRTTDALKDLLDLAPKTALIERDGTVSEVPVEEIKAGDVFVCRAGDLIPVDGVVIEGETSVDESALTGESIPADRETGDRISSGTINLSGYIRAKATHVGEDTTISQIIQMVSDAASTKAPIARVADRVSGVFVPAVIGIAALVTLIWLITGAEAGHALSRGIAVLVISCPCALGLATPVAIMAGSGVGARQGILFKTAASIEEVGKIKTIALDKTGTITEGVPVVTDVFPAEGVDEEYLLSRAAALEEGSEHPLGKAVVAYASERNVSSVTVESIKTIPGRGIEGRLTEDNGATKTILGGSRKYIESIASVPGGVIESVEKAAEEGKTALLFALDDSVLGAIAVADTIKDDSISAIACFRNMGIEAIMLTGDQEKTARAIGKQVGVDDIRAEVLPQDKERVIRGLEKKGPVAMVGDGINDAPALMRANIGIAIGAGADVAIDAADIVLIKSRLSDVAAAIRLSRKTLRNIHENLFWAFIYNVLLIPLAAGAFTGLLQGWTLNPMLAAAAMSISSFCVCMNALRLNLVDVHDASSDRPLRSGVKEKKPEHVYDDKEEYMRKTIMVEGMMCPHCEATVKKALEELPQVDIAEVSHEAGSAVVDLNAEIDDNDLKKAIEEKDYSVISVS